MADAPQLTFEGILGYGVSDAGEAAHFFEHMLGLALGADEGDLRLYAVGEGLTIAALITGGERRLPPFLLFSTPDVRAAAEHFTARGCVLQELPFAPGAPGFIAATQEGHVVGVVDEKAME